MKRSTLLLMAFLALSASVFAACGGDDSTDEIEDSATFSDGPHSGG